MSETAQPLSGATTADRIRAHVIAKHIEPARLAGQGTVVVRAGDIHREMGLANAMPSVCGAIGSDKLLRDAAVVLIDRTGPRNGANVFFEFSLDASRAQPVVTEVRSDRPQILAAPKPTQPRQLDLSHALALVSCVKSKLATPAAAKDLYTSDWFRKVRAIVESQHANWFILSALHGLVSPDTVIEPYEKTLITMSAAERHAWSDKVLRQLDPLLVGRSRVIFFAGERYRQFLVGPLQARGLSVEVPMNGLTIGRQLSWLGGTE